MLVKGRSDWILGVIEKRLGPTTYWVKLSDGRTWRRHIELLKWLPRRDIESTASAKDKEVSVPFFPLVERTSDPTASPSGLPNTPAVQSSLDPAAPSFTPAASTTPPAVSTTNPLPPPASSSFRYPRRIRREPDRYCDSYMHT